jgi:hypothetical protein
MEWDAANTDATATGPQDDKRGDWREAHTVECEVREHHRLPSVRNLTMLPRLARMALFSRA